MLTKDFLKKADCRTAFGAVEDSLLWTCEQRATSLTAILASRPDCSPVWIFGYGSLMWNPVFESDDVAEGTLEGWHRAFCLRLTSGRGSASQPGRMLALKEGGRTIGLAYRLPENQLQEELELLWKREMPTGCYLPTWCELMLVDGRKVTAIAFIMNPCHPLYESDSCPKTIAPLIAQASGPLGTNAQYLFALEQELQKRGLYDDCLTDIVERVREIQQCFNQGVAG
ncbi:gamma-glutamylcyclotransferase [Erwinia tracheiphila]|uniref:glutathione-specific gamma-glutamylcyclotransferase n=1 Tax=Erwinia tracheiphila TaxID=65700 RepID=A0A0M2K5Z6_9GAMM|nr:gamma-glutamylcyclotransferase [Erwinia tracheiphila]AXF76010.1 gamma-glutamylcyclotransferase [Erwinia tracheiphila]EOS96746.1 Cation transport protein [Erwinia tracheiphila PSU-1]KKF34800.1 transporter [Erwinia tracheiphila]UIA85330.1 gamma-glutamylcyclotransferase [Erwinia tracheiphila]UIA86471.1 gamma-glutamylcyclotransferase [Erwinia tracheiphila]